MKKRRYTARLLSMAVAANLVFSSLAMPVFSADLTSLETELSTEMQGETEISSEEEASEKAASVEETESQAETETRDETEMESQAETETAPEAAAEAEIQTETASEETETQAMTETESETVAETEAQTEAVSAKKTTHAVQAADPGQEKTPDIFLTKGNDYEASFNRPDDSVPVIGAPKLSFDGEIKDTDSSVALTIGGRIPEGCVLLVKKYDADAASLVTQEGTLVSSRLDVSEGKMVLDSMVSFAGGEKIVAFLLQNGTVIAQTDPAVVAAIPDFTVTQDNGPVTEETTELTFTVKAKDDSITNINIAALCRVDENGNVDPTSADSYVARLFGQKPGTLHFTGISGLKAGEKLRLVLVYNNGNSRFYGEDIPVLAPLVAERVTILNTEINTETKEVSVVVTGCETYNGGFLILSTGNAATDGDGDRRTRLGSKTFTGAGTYTFAVNTGLKAGNTVQAYLYKYDADSDRVFYKYSDSVSITENNPVLKEAKVEIVTDTIRADRTYLWAAIDFDEGLTGILKLYTYEGESFDRTQAKEIYSGPASPAENRQRVTFGKGKLTAGKKIIAELLLSDETTVLSNSKEIQPEPEKVKPTVSITSEKVTAGMTHIKAVSNFDSSFSQASFKLYQFTGEALDTENDTVIFSGNAYYSNRGNVSFYCGGKLKVGAKLQLVMTVGDEEVRSNVVEVQPSPDWGTPYAAFEVSAVKSNAESVEVTVDYSDEYLTLGDDFYCDVTVYEFSGAYSDQEFEDNELWENSSKVQRVAQVNSRLGDVTRGKLTIPIKAGVTLNPGDRLIIKLRLPHTEWEGEEVDYLSTSIPIVGENETITAPRALLYNLSADTSMGLRLRKILEEQGIEAVDVADSQLNESLGYLAGMEGYEANSEPYSGKGSSTEFMVMANFAEAQLDRFLDAMTANGIRIDHKAVATAYNVDYEFHRLIDDIKEEHETFQALITLNQLVKDAEKLTEEQYGNAERWAEFKAALKAANDVLTSVEPSLEDLQKADAALRAPYLTLTGMTELAGEAVITLIPQEDGTYNMEASLKGAAEGSVLNYQWSSGETGAVLEHVKAEELITKTVTITGENQYGSKKAQLQVAAKPEIKVTAGKNQLEISIAPQQGKDNCPAPLSYTVVLYKDGKQLASQKLDNTELHTVFDGLDSENDYTVKVYAESLVGRSDTAVMAVKTTVAESEKPGESEKPSESEAPAESEKPAESEAPAESEKPAESEAPAESEKPVESETPAETEVPAETEAPTETETETSSETETTKETESETTKTTEASKTTNGNDSNSGNNTQANAPKTGDPTDTAILLFLLALSGMAALGTALWRKSEEK